MPTAADRARLLQALAEVELDQIIILPHDAEVPPAEVRKLGDAVRQTFLVRFDRATKVSHVHPGEYFEEPGPRPVAGNRAG